MRTFPSKTCSALTASYWRIGTVTSLGQRPPKLIICSRTDQLMTRAPRDQRLDSGGASNLATFSTGHTAKPPSTFGYRSAACSAGRHSHVLHAHAARRAVELPVGGAAATTQVGDEIIIED